MDFKIRKDSNEPSTTGSADKGKQNVMLAILLVLVAGFAYVYFFTGLIKPQETPKPPEAPAPQAVKKPLPPREEQPAKPAATGAPEVKKDAAAPSAPAKPEPPKTAASTAPAAKTPIPAKEEPKKTEPAKVAKAEEKKPVTPVKQPAAAPVKTAPEKAAPAKTADTKKAGTTPAGATPAAAQKPVAAKPAKKAVPESKKSSPTQWTVVVGNYVLENALASDLGRVKKAGLDATVQQGSKRKVSMNRLFLGEYEDRASAMAELAKLKRQTSDAFILDQGGKHAVYAGSYLLDSLAVSEKERLAAYGFKLDLKRAEVAIPSKTLTAGTFKDKKSAEAALKKLKDIGIDATLSHQ